MGVQGLIALLRKHAPTAFKPCLEEDLRGTRVGVDLSITLYRGAAVSYKHGGLSHLETLLREVRWLLRLGCQPIYVLDGHSPQEKKEELDKREAIRVENEARLQAFLKEFSDSLSEEEKWHSTPTTISTSSTTPGETQQRLQALQKRCIRMTPEMRDDAKSLLALLGIRLVQAASEAEHCLAEMMRQGLLDHIFTEDIDVLVCGAPSYIKNSTLLMYASENETEGYSGGLSEKKVAEKVSLQPVLDGLNVTREGFALLAVFSGCDFAPKMPRFGPATALKHVTKHHQDLALCFSDVNGSYRHLQQRYEKAVQLFLSEATFQDLTYAEVVTPPLDEFLQALQNQGSIAYVKVLIEDIQSLQKETHRPSKRSRSEAIEKPFMHEQLESPSC